MDALCADPKNVCAITLHPPPPHILTRPSARLSSSSSRHHRTIRRRTSEARLRCSPSRVHPLLLRLARRARSFPLPLPPPPPNLLILLLLLFLLALLLCLHLHCLRCLPPHCLRHRRRPPPLVRSRVLKTHWLLTASLLNHSVGMVWLGHSGFVLRQSCFSNSFFPIPPPLFWKHWWCSVPLSSAFSWLRMSVSPSFEQLFCLPMRSRNRKRKPIR